MARSIGIVLLLAMTAGLLAGCGGAREQVIVVGELAALTGGTAAWGTAQSNAFKIYVDELNKAGGLDGVKVKVVTYDFKGDAQEAVNAFNRLADQDKVVMVFGTNNSNANLAFAPLAEQKKVPVLANAVDPNVTTPKMTGLNRYSFLTVASNIVQGKTMAAYALKELGFKRVAVLYNQGNAFATTMVRPFIDYFKANGGDIVAEEVFQGSDVEYRAQLTRIKAANPDAILLPNYYKEIALAAQQARELGINVPFLGHTGWPSQVLLQMAAKEVEGSYYVNYASFQDPKLKAIRDKYFAAYKIEPEINAAMIHDSFEVFKDAVKRIGARNLAGMSVDKQRDALRDAFESTKDVAGLTGTITIDHKTHRPENIEMAIIKVENGAFKLVTRYKAP
ncbi:MAG: ABC transporter substrate-binding protein [Firmicutes bacterium]|nr:ABC transporter substrate-binding protein [Bacillota bacterium]